MQVKEILNAYESCTWVLAEIANGRLDGVIDAEIIQELLYRYGAGITRLDPQDLFTNK